MTRRRAIPDGVWNQRISRNIYNLNSFCLDWIKFEGIYDMPVIEPCYDVPSNLFPYDERHKWKEGSGAIHFYCEDNKFESVWLRANRFPHYPAIVGRAGTATTPDFSLYTDYPKVTQIWNVYRARLLGSLWQHQEIDVIPSVCWGDRSTFEWCFDGLPRNSVVSVSTGHIRYHEQKGFLEGFKEMVSRLNPSTVLVYGRGLKNELEAVANVRRYDSQLTKVRKERQKRKSPQLSLL